MDLLTRQRGEARERLDALRSETTHLEFVDAALAGVSSEAIETARATLGLDRGPTQAARPRPTAKRRRPAKRGERRAQVLGVVRAHPDGITAPEIAKKIKAQSTYVYRPLNELATAGEIVKDGDKWKSAPGVSG